MTMKYESKIGCKLFLNKQQTKTKINICIKKSKEILNRLENKNCK